ncbi:hypothetical protein BJ684DRAFT_20088, partial [Piptocephalis cylindrospora]
MHFSALVSLVAVAVVAISTSVQAQMPPGGMGQPGMPPPNMAQGAMGQPGMPPPNMAQGAMGGPGMPGYGGGGAY